MCMYVVLVEKCIGRISFLVETFLHYTYGEVSSLVVNIMTDNVMNAWSGKSGTRLKREI